MFVFGARVKKQHFINSCVKEVDKVIYISVIKGLTSIKFLSRIIMCEFMKNYLWWNPGDKNVARKAMVEHSLALLERIRKVVVS